MTKKKEEAVETLESLPTEKTENVEEVKTEETGTTEDVEQFSNFVLKAGTQVFLGNNPVVLAQDTPIQSEGFTEQAWVGMLITAGVFEQHKDLLKGNYNSFGQLAD
jgi:hypothetical protein